MVTPIYHLDSKDCPKAPKVNCSLYIEDDANISEIQPQKASRRVFWFGILFGLYYLSVIMYELPFGKESNGKWYRFANKDYIALEGYFTFDSCREKCTEMKSQMVSIHSDLENEFVFNISTTGRMDGDHNDCSWIGVQRCSKQVGANPGWCNVDSSPVDYVKWDSWNGTVEPNNSDGWEDCVELYSDKSCPNKDCQAKWNDIDCDWKHKICVCKK